jgi:hypothetical protein
LGNIYSRQCSLKKEEAHGRIRERGIEEEIARPN